MTPVSPPPNPSETVEKRPNSTGRAVAHQVAWVTGGRILAAVLQAASLILAARALPVAQFGFVTAYLGVTTLVQALADFGVGTFLSRERAAHPDSGGVDSALRFTTITAAGVVALTMGGLGVAALVISPVFWLMLPLALAAAGERNADVRLSVAFADGDVHVSMFNLVARRTSAIVIFLVALKLDIPPLLAFCTAAGAAAAASATFASIYIRPRISTPANLTYRELLHKARPFWFTSLAVQARNLDAVLVAALAGGAQAGLYSSGSRLIGPLQLLPSSLASVLLPAAARSKQSRRTLVSLLQVSLVVLGGLTLIYAALFVAAPTLVARGLGDRYAGSETVIRIILLGLPFSSAGSLLTSILQGQGRGKAVALSWTISTSSCLIGVAIAAPLTGARGAATVLTLSFVVQFVALLRALQRVWRELDQPDQPGCETTPATGAC